MGNKIFVSYKYADKNVRQLSPYYIASVRDYVDLFEEQIDKSDHIYKGESDGEDLSNLSEDLIWEKLKNRIYDSSVTVIFISRGMREIGVLDRNQWIPWEIAYSLKEISRSDRSGNNVTSHTNAILSVVLPDRNNSYSYFQEEARCDTCSCTSYKTSSIFSIIKKNMFNRIKNETKCICDNNDIIWIGECSYIEPVKWDSFIDNYNLYISRAIERQNNIDDYRLCKEV